MLLPRLNSPKSPIKMNTATPNPLPLEAPSTAKMVEPPVCDIFLCDYCGADFNTLPAIKVFIVSRYSILQQNHNTGPKFSINRVIIFLKLY